ncbi:SDR family NAD(P)-dependent oxidoreductase [Alkalihalobacterium elongatum]|uniref:SDR family NAD(P)-dependent oxidoreductase n=1 Tax=Alkalihalobacterium elongatum TaxID=2675466 RepID=UPI001C2001CE|nr:SDR family NAD(P)-dependent oxidoreductase [Alkalihalobacterium elongatum]
MRIQNKVAIVSGSGSGIGKETALRFAREGAKVLCMDIKGQEDTVRQIVSENGKAIAFEGDVTNSSDWKKAVQLVLEEYGTIDILANIAGVVSRGSDKLLEQTEEEWHHVIDIDLKGTFLGMKSVMPEMVKNKKGKIVNVASLAAHIGLTNLVAYSAAKGGVAAMTRQVAMEYAADNIQVNAVSPGIIQTPILGDTTPEMTEIFSAATPAGRLGKPEEIANLILFFASEEADFVTGQIWKVDGGWGSQ